MYYFSETLGTLIHHAKTTSLKPNLIPSLRHPVPSHSVIPPKTIQATNISITSQSLHIANASPLPTSTQTPRLPLPTSKQSQGVTVSHTLTTLPNISTKAKYRNTNTPVVTPSHIRSWQLNTLVTPTVSNCQDEFLYRGVECWSHRRYCDWSLMQSNEQGDQNQVEGVTCAGGCVPIF